MPKSLTTRKIAAALRREIKACIRKRLIAIHAILSGKDVSVAALMAKSTPESVRRWIGLAEEGGLDVLLYNNRKVYRLDMPHDVLALTLAEIEDLLATERRPWACTRLRAIKVLLTSRRTLKQAALRAEVHPDRLSLWWRWVRNEGCARLLSQGPFKEPTPSAMTAAEMTKAENGIDRLLAQRPPLSPRTQQRLRALRLAVRGKIEEAAATNFMSPTNIEAWLRVLRKQGPQALIEKPHPGRPSRSTAKSKG